MIPLWSGLVLGFLGSLHCIGMCGPIVLALPGAPTRTRFAAARLAYNVGRATTYTLLGAVAGTLGQGLALAGLQRALGIGTGALMIAAVVLTTLAPVRLSAVGPVAAFVSGLKARLGAYLVRPSLASQFVIGTVNGFLPCGLVYVALAAAVGAGSLAGGAWYMFLFGLGTAPALLGVAFASGLVAFRFRRALARVLPYAVALMGLFFVLRGLSLGIPLLSPNLRHPGAVPAAADSARAVPDCCR